MVGMSHSIVLTPDDSLNRGKRGASQLDHDTNFLGENLDWVTVKLHCKCISTVISELPQTT